jgi:solute carrier family 25 (mitochondrial carnitine/acylcarnitine transporter), member 20/29
MPERPSQTGIASTTGAPQPPTASPASRGTHAASMPFPSQFPQSSWEEVLTNDRKRWMKKYRTEISACSSSLLSTFAAYPLDSVKTRMQAYKFTSFADCVRHTYNTEGIHGFWRGKCPSVPCSPPGTMLMSLTGVWSPLASITLVRTVSFTIYQKTKYALDATIYRTTGQSPLEIANTKGAVPTLSTIACFGISGATAGACITTLACKQSCRLELFDHD